MINPRKMVVKTSERTNLSSEIYNQSRSTDYLSNTLSVESKILLSRYQKNLTISRGLGSAGLDKPMVALIKEFAWDVNMVEEEMEYLDNLRDPDGYPFSRCLKRFCMADVGFQKMIRPFYAVRDWTETFEAAYQEMIAIFSQWHLKPLTFTCDDDVKDALPKVNTHSGYLWIETGRKYKGDNIEGIYSNFEAERLRILKGEHVTHPVLLGFRTQASGEYTDDGERTDTCKHKLRIVYMVDLRLIVRELMFSKPMQEKMAQWKWYAGGKDSEAIASRISDMKSRLPYFVSADWSAFDQSIHKKLLYRAFEIAKAAFDLSPDQEVLWNEMVYQFIHKEIILDKGVLNVDKIIQSGSMWTQMIGTIIDILVCLTYFNSCGVKRRDFLCMSDDILMYVDQQVDIHHMATYMKFNFDMDLSEDGKTNCNDALHAPKFLARFWKVDGPYRDPKLLLSRLLYPERYREYAEDWKTHFDNNNVYPAHVLYAFILTYPGGMRKLIDVDSFLKKYTVSDKFVKNYVDSRYVPGVMAYIRDYT